MFALCDIFSYLFFDIFLKWAFPDLFFDIRTSDLLVSEATPLPDEHLTAFTVDQTQDGFNNT